MTDPAALTGQRTSRWVLLLHTITFRQARALVPAVLALGATRGFDGGTVTVVALVVGVTLLSLLWAALSWWRFSYAVGETSVVVTRGLLSRSVRTVPLDRVRGVEIEAPALHRLFGLVRVEVDAAAGSAGATGEELVVDGVSRAEGDRLRARLLARRAVLVDAAGAGDVAAPVEEPEEVVTRFDPRWLLYSPLVGGYLAVPLAAFGALFRLLEEVPDRFVPDLDRPGLPDGTLAALVLAGGLVLLVVGSIAGSAVVNWRFRLVRRGGSLIATRGLVTRRHTELEIDRIRGCTVSQGVGMRLVGAARASALVTGLGDAARRGQLLPLGPQDQAWALADRLVERTGPLRRHPAAARRRSVVRGVVPGVLVLVAGVVLTVLAGWWPLLVTGAVLTGLGVPLGLARHAATGHATGPRSFAVRSGWLVREHVVLQRRAVVGWQVRQSFTQRRGGLATVLACVGAGSGGYAARDMAADEAADFARAASGAWADTLDPAR
ncbi:PH domain-containing protein [Modestobacter sp. VKM Ac-2986]|uniref:PH domain-containing protein n=1 Tax=Modestobacter sp. VKM Ac-2986 TaxID=3004140 RepID=UPI0022AB8381|nr:PH domain-containing protein [Modestobacter sp. VKM Ac-2986]MCZ2830988.1 PH domain-containing protein [Modestobacter sp. VKM Ac-2986]